MSEKPTALDAVKIQARAVIPIVRALERELGKERAHSIVGRAIAESYAEWQAKTVSARNSHPREVKVNTEEQLPIEAEVVEDTDSTCAINMEMPVRRVLPRNRSSGRRGASHLRCRLRSGGRPSPRLGVSPHPDSDGRRDAL